MLEACFIPYSLLFSTGSFIQVNSVFNEEKNPSSLLQLSNTSNTSTYLPTYYRIVLILVVASYRRVSEGLFQELMRIRLVK